ncbi:MAG: hypothetical protein JW818_12765 [Pirellulales bacterium]|nr:hypothetical protein [Pirellulales bacterium]
MTLAAAILAIPFLLLGCAPIISWAIKPLTQAAARNRGPSQFTIADFLCLFVLIQVPTALIQMIQTNSRLLLVLTGVAWLLVGLAWAYGVGQMSQAGIRRGRHRAGYLLLIFPTVFLSVMSLPFCMVALFAGLEKGHMLLVVGSLMLIAWAVVGLPLARRFTCYIVETALADERTREQAHESDQE